MIDRTTLPLLALMAVTPVTAHELHTDALSCAGELPEDTELRITYVLGRCLAVVGHAVGRRGVA